MKSKLSEIHKEGLSSKLFDAWKGSDKAGSYGWSRFGGFGRVQGGEHLHSAPHRTGAGSCPAPASAYDEDSHVDARTKIVLVSPSYLAQCVLAWTGFVRLHFNAISRPRGIEVE